MMSNFLVAQDKNITSDTDILKLAKMREKIAYSLPGRCQVAYEAGEETQALDRAVKLISAASFLADVVKARKLFARSKSWYDNALKFRVR